MVYNRPCQAKLSILDIIISMYGQRIRECRQEKGYTQEEAAARLNITRSTFAKYEREELQPNIDMIILICKLFEVSADYLLGITDL